MSGRRPTVLTRLGVLALAGVTIASACGDDGDGDGPRAVTLVAYSSFPTGDSPVTDALARFTERTGIDVQVLVSGDTGTMLSKAELTAGNPEGDVMWGVDTTFLSRAVDGGVFDPYESPALDELDPALVALVPDHVATPVDFGDVCVNSDLGWFAEQGLEPPGTFEDLADPAYRDLLVVENAATSSPGLAFLLATVAHFGEDGWQAYWTSLRDNGVTVVDSWDQAYDESFTRYGGDRPLVVSYGSSPPYEVLASDPPATTSPTGVLESTCYRQVEFAGVLRGTDAPDEARQLVDFLASTDFQSTVADNLYVFPANSSVALDPVFQQFAVIPDDPLQLPPATIGEHREQWTDEWTQLVLG